MRLGDSYKIKSLSKSGVSDSDIIKRFKNSYGPKEIKRFIPGKAEAPEPKATRRKKAAE